MMKSHDIVARMAADSEDEWESSSHNFQDKPKHYKKNCAVIKAERKPIPLICIDCEQKFKAIEQEMRDIKKDLEDMKRKNNTNRRLTSSN